MTRIAAAARAGLALTLFCAAGCGHRGALAPPLPRVPAGPRDVVWRQRGDRLEVLARYVLSTLDGRALRARGHPTVLFAAPQNEGQAAGWATPTRERESLRAAAAAPLNPFEDVKPGEVRTRFDSLALADLGGTNRVVIALALEDKSSRSAVSPRILVQPVAPPLAELPEFAASSVENGVALRWTAPPDERVRVVRIYRWRVGEDIPWTPWRTAPVDKDGVLDEAARFGDDLVYEACSGTQEDAVPAESLPRRAPVVAHRDVFPPAQPRDLDAVPETGRVRVFWRPGGSPDEAAAIVERQLEGDQNFVQAAVVELPDSHFVDEMGPLDRRRRYRVSSVDKLGNRTEPVGPTEWVAPRPAL